MKILITGITGFIGNTLATRLIEKGYEVHGLTRFTSGKWNIPPKAKIHVADLTDKISIRKTIESIRPEIIFHLGAITPVSESFKMPKLYTETNYIGTINIAEETLTLENFKAFIYASTSEVYGNQGETPITEDQPPKPNTPYAISKHASEQYLLNYLHKAYNYPVIIARPFNTYARANVNQPHYIVEKLITSMLRNKKHILLGSNVKRDFLYRDDHINGYISILNAIEKDRDIYGEIYNFSTEKPTSIKELATKIAEETGWNGEIIWGIYTRPIETHTLVGSNRKADAHLGWKPRYTLEDGLKQAIKEWRRVLET